MRNLVISFIRMDARRSLMLFSLATELRQVCLLSQATTELSTVVGV